MLDHTFENLNNTLVLKDAIVIQHICTLYIVECSTFNTRSLNVNIFYQMCARCQNFLSEAGLMSYTPRVYNCRLYNTNSFLPEVQNRKGSESCVSHVYVQYQVQAANPPETVLYSLSHKVLICFHCLDNNFLNIS